MTSSEIMYKQIILIVRKHESEIFSGSRLILQLLGDGHICYPHCQSSIKVGLTHLIENRFDAIVSVVLASTCEKDTKAIRTHWLNQGWANFLAGGPH